MKYFIVYLSSASKLEIEDYAKLENAVTRKGELSAQMISARLIVGDDISTDLAQEAHKKALVLFEQMEASSGPEDEEVDAEVEGNDAPSEEGTTLEVELKNADLVDGDVQTLPQSDVIQEEVSADTVAKNIGLDTQANAQTVTDAQH